MTEHDEEHPDSLERLFVRTLRCAGRVFAPALRRSVPDHLTPPQLFLLNHLREQPAQPSELAREQHVGMSAITAVVDGLVARGLVERCPDPQDRRAVRLVITPTGREVCAEVEARVLEATRELLAPLSPAQRARLGAALADLA